MARLPDISKNFAAFLDTIAHSELGGLLKVRGSDDGYKVIVGSTVQHPILFDSYADHPRRRILISRLGVWSSAAGRYQFIKKTWDGLALLLGLQDFSPENQDRACIQLIRQRQALGFVEAGHIRSAIFNCAGEWASLPRHSDDLHGVYQQGANHTEGLVSLFRSYGGELDE